MPSRQTPTPRSAKYQHPAFHRTAKLLGGLITSGLVAACGGGGSATAASTTATTTTTTAATGTGTSTAGVACTYSHSALNSTPSVNATSTANWTCSTTARALVANGLPDHAVGMFPNADNPNSITAQTVSANLTLMPNATTSATTVGGRTTTGYVLNGVKIDASTAGTCTDAGTCSAIGGAARGILKP